MGMIYVMSNIVSSVDLTGISAHCVAGYYEEVEPIRRIKVHLRNGSNSNELRFWLCRTRHLSHINPNLCTTLCTYENGNIVSIGVKYLVANQAKLLEIDSSGNVADTVAFSSRGMTKETLESIPESKLIEFSRPDSAMQYYSVLISWERNGASPSDVFPVEKIEISGKRYKGMANASIFWPPARKTILSKTYKFQEARNIKWSDFTIEGDPPIIYPSIPTFTNHVQEFLNYYWYVAGTVLCGSYKKSNGEWSRWKLINENMEEETDVIAIKFMAWLGVTKTLFTVSDSGGAGRTNNAFLGPTGINSVTFDRQTASGTYVGGNFTTKTLHLSNEAKKVHATIVHKEGLDVKAYVSLRSEGNFVSGESLGVGNGNSRSVTLQHTNGLTNEGFKLYFNGVEQEISSYAFASGSGLVTFTAANGVQVSCDYYYNAGAENFVEMTRSATYRNEDKAGMLESQFKYETNIGGKVVTFKAEVSGDGRIEAMSVFFNQ